MSVGVKQTGLDRAAHVVHFYRSDEELTGSVGLYLSEALDHGSTAIVVATAGHHAAFDRRLAARGFDIEAVRARGDLLALDAAQTIRRFLIGGQPDPGGFELVMGGLIRQAAATGRPVRVYGEMVALLWAAGHVNAAIELEAIWVGLTQHLPFSLLCAYPAPLVAGADQAGALHQVCHLHTAVIGIPPGALMRRAAAGPAVKATRSFAADTSAPEAAREFVVEMLGRWGDQDFAEDAALITAELASNAVAHARSGFTVGISRGAGVVRIAVRDCSPMPPGGSSRLEARPGHGLGLVATTASRWAAESLADGKMVWAEL
jgi:anti-sigma regulatory factor (Ser/Thr protein kinase)